MQANFETIAVNLLVYVLLLRAKEEGKPTAEATALMATLESSLVKDLDILKVKTEQQEFSALFLESRLLRPLFNNLCWKFGSPKIVQRLMSLVKLPVIATFLSTLLHKLETQAARTVDSGASSRKNSASFNEPISNLAAEKPRSAQKPKRVDQNSAPETATLSKNDRGAFLFQHYIKPNEKSLMEFGPAPTPVARAPPTLAPSPERDVFHKIRKPPAHNSKNRSIKVVLDRDRLKKCSKKSFNCQSTIDQSYNEILRQESMFCVEEPSAGKAAAQGSGKKPERGTTTSISEFVFEHGDLTVQGNWENDFDQF